jgi:hypothetical protein
MPMKKRIRSIAVRGIDVVGEVGVRGCRDHG